MWKIQAVLSIVNIGRKSSLAPDYRRSLNKFIHEFHFSFELSGEVPMEACLRAMHSQNKNHLTINKVALSITFYLNIYIATHFYAEEVRKRMFSPSIVSLLRLRLSEFLILRYFNNRNKSFTFLSPSILAKKARSSLILQNTF